jgi:nicotinamide mononucleotide adenylyltransferase
MTKLENKEKRFVALKGQPIHKGHCYLIEEMLHDASEEEIIMIGIVNLDCTQFSGQ